MLLAVLIITHTTVCIHTGVNVLEFRTLTIDSCVAVVVLLQYSSNLMFVGSRCTRGRNQLRLSGQHDNGDVMIQSM